MKGKVFIIDDDTIILEGMKQCLELEGYEVGVASSAMTAAFLLRRFDPDVVLLDLQMPALGGERLLSLDRARTFPPDARIILWSGRAESELAAFAERAGADDFHAKGDDLDRLLAKVERYAARAQTLRSGTTAVAESVIVLRTNQEGGSTTAVDLEAGGYIVIEALTDEEALARLDARPPAALVVETSFYPATRLLASVRTCVPVLVVSPLGEQIQRRFPFVHALGPRLQRYDLIAAVDRILIDGSRLAAR